MFTRDHSACSAENQVALLKNTCRELVSRGGPGRGSSRCYAAGWGWGACAKGRGQGGLWKASPVIHVLPHSLSTPLCPFHCGLVSLALSSTNHPVFSDTFSGCSAAYLPSQKPGGGFFSHNTCTSEMGSELFPLVPF